MKEGYLAFASQFHEFLSVGLIFRWVGAKNGIVVDVIFIQKSADFSAIRTLFDDVEVEHGMNG